MNYETKYKQALERARIWQNHLYDTNDRDYADELNYIFPELKESEDERIRKAIHIYLDWLDGRKDYAPKGIYSIKDMIAWLEKQGVQKSIEPLKLSDIDKAMVESRIVEDLLIMRACEWLRGRLSLTNLDKFINEFKKAMKGD